MIHNPVYANQTNDAGERVSTNGYWTGHQKGSVMQDATVSGVTPPYTVEGSTVHMGAMLQDAKDAAFPTVVED
jgi:hypothetical protein